MRTRFGEAPPKEAEVLVAATDPDSTSPRNTVPRSAAESRAVSLLGGVYDDPHEAASLARRIVSEARSLAREVEAGGSERESRRMFSEHLGIGMRGLQDEDALRPVPERFTHLVVSSLDRDLARDRERTPDETRLRAEELLRELTDARALRRLPPEARAARQEIETASPATDDLRSLLVTPEDRTRAEHADHLGRTNKTARELYERGADVYGDILVLPLDPHEREQARDEIKISSLTYAVNTFERFIEDRNEAQRTAAEFVELANAIAGRTADSDLRLAVFRTYYDRVRRDHREEVHRQRDGSEISLIERGDFLPPQQQKERLGTIIEEMRETAAVLTPLEWKTSPHKLIEIGEWERGLSSRQEHAQDEEHGYRTPDAALTNDEVEREQQAEREGGRALIEHASVRLDEAPPMTPRVSDVARANIAELLLEVDQRLAQGTRPAEVQNFLTNQEAQQAEREQTEEIKSLFERRGLAAEFETSVTREDELAALYTLHALATSADRHGAASKATVEIDKRIEELQPYTVERLTALVTVRDKAARSLAFEEERLAAFAHAEQGLAALERIERAYRAHVRLTPEWQHERATLREQVARREPTTNTEVSRERRLLIAELNVPLVTEFKNRLAAEAGRHQARYRGITGHEELTSEKARALVMPRLEQTRALHDCTVAEIAALRERTGAPLPERNLIASERNELYLSPASNGRVRLPVTSFGEYQIIARLAENLNRAESRRDRVRLSLAVSPDLWRAPVNSDNAERAAVFQFARDYTNYRAHDAQTRLRASNSLARDYLQRLERTATPDEMRREVVGITHENRDRREHPEKYRTDEERAGRRGEGTRRALRDDELRQVLLASSPAHHTDEMRAIRVEAVTPAGVRARHERARQTADLEHGRAQPSPALRVLLTEMERVRSPRDMKLFYAQMLNNPQELPRNLPRISRENLFVAHESLARVERDYVFGKLEARRVELTR